MSRLIDRPLRPLFPPNFHNEVQIIATLLSLNSEIPADIPAMIGASAALMISGIPFEKPLSAARIGYKDGTYLINPSYKDLNDSQLDLVIAATKDAVLMVESEAQELSEDVLLGAIFYGQEMMQTVLQAITEFSEQVTENKVRRPTDLNLENTLSLECESLVQGFSTSKIIEALSFQDKLKRQQSIMDIEKQTIENFQEKFSISLITETLHKIRKDLVRKSILRGEPRVDGRDHQKVRPISIRTGVLDSTHGSALFTRGETQVLVSLTLGNERDAQILENSVGEPKDRFMLHYNFPPFSVGEVGMVGTPKRREIGHGKLAKRSLMAVMPPAKDFPYVVRLVSETTESNGSSSMASICGSSLALMDGGVPIAAPVAGVAMGLIKDEEDYAILTDISGEEDYLGDMDFKVAGTKKGITALQMDMKISNITSEIMQEALAQASGARLHILELMNKSLSEHRPQISPHAPRIVTMKVAEDKIRTIIGKGGSTIRSLIEKTQVEINIDESGLIQMCSNNASYLVEAEKQIRALIAEVEVGKSYLGKVLKIVEFGAFINLLPGKDGLLHISQICQDRNQKIEDILKEGQDIEVFIAGVDKQGRVKLEWLNKDN